MGKKGKKVPQSSKDKKVPQSSDKMVENVPQISMDEMVKKVDELYESVMRQDLTEYSLKKTANNYLKELETCATEEERNNPVGLPYYEYLKGKLLYLGTYHSKEHDSKAEYHLSQCVKLRPSLTDGWICLSDCMKRNDLSAAISCLEQALFEYDDELFDYDVEEKKKRKAEQNAEKKKIFVQLSKLASEMGDGAKQSISYANDALLLDFNDKLSWCALGNAHLRAYDESATWNYDDVDKSVSAYKQAYKQAKSMDFSTFENFMLSYAKVLTDLGKFGTAIEVYNELPKTLEYKCRNKVKDIHEYLERYKRAYYGFFKKESEEYFERLFCRWASVLPELNLTQSLQCVTVGQLKEGKNKDSAMVVGVVYAFEKMETRFPTWHFVAIDSCKQLFLLSLHGSDDYEEIEYDYVVTLLNPGYHTFKWEKMDYHIVSGYIRENVSMEKGVW